MTIIVGYTNGVSTWLGADGRGTAGKRILAENDQKIIRFRSWALGIGGDFISNNLVEENDEFLAEAETPQGIRQRLYRLFRENGLHDGGDFPAQMFLARAGQLWHLDNGFSLSEIPPHRYEALGSGQQYALGALYANPERRIKTKIREAIKAAAYYDMLCGGKVTIHVLRA